MELVNEMYRHKELNSPNMPLLKSALTKLVLILSPFAPHICEELWQELGNNESVYQTAWPSFDEKALKQDTVEIVVQINGKIKEKLEVDTNLGKTELENLVMANPAVAALLQDKEIVKLIAVPKKLVNIVVK